MSNATNSKPAAEASKGWTGRGPLSNLIAELQRQRETKFDVILDSRTIGCESTGAGRLRLVGIEAQSREWLGGIGSEGAVLSDNALYQMGLRCDPVVPKKFASELAAMHGATAARLFDDLLHAKGKRHFLRCIDGRVRAVLSDKYLVVDNYDLAFTALEVGQANGAELLECSLSDAQMHVKLTTRDLWETIDEGKAEGRSIFAGQQGNIDRLRSFGQALGGELPGGEGTVFPLLTISNSETGQGGLGVRLGIFRGACSNGIIYEDVVTRIHVGERQQTGIFTAATIAKESEVILAKCKDAIAAAFHPAKFAKIVAAAKNATSDKIEAPSAAVDNVVKSLSLTEEAKDSILKYFLRDNGSNRYGLAQSVARYAQDVDDGDIATGLETAAGKILKGEKLDKLELATA